MPLKEIVPVFIDVHKDGVVDPSKSMSVLPASTRQAAIEAELWSYVRHREHYNFAEAAYDYEVVSGLSAPAVRDDYQAAVNPKNPDAPINRLGQKTTITLRRISGGYLTHSQDYTAGTYQIRYAARVHEDERPGHLRKNVHTLQLRSRGVDPARAAGHIQPGRDCRHRLSTSRGGSSGLNRPRRV